MVVERSKRYEEVLEDDEDEIDLWQPKARDRRLTDAYLGIDREEC